MANIRLKRSIGYETQQPSQALKSKTGFSRPDLTKSLPVFEYFPQVLLIAKVILLFLPGIADLFHQIDQAIRCLYQAPLLPSRF